MKFTVPTTLILSAAAQSSEVGVRTEIEVISDSHYLMTLNHWIETDYQGTDWLYMESELEKKDGTYQNGWVVEQSYEFGNSDRGDHS